MTRTDVVLRSPDRIGAVERGERNVSFTNLVPIAKAPAVTVSQLLSGLEKRADALKAPVKDRPQR
jgi:hypothetical protein